MIWTLMVLAGCGDKDSLGDDSVSEGDADTDTDTDTDTDVDLPASTLAGNVDTRDGLYTGTVAIQKAFSFYSGKKTYVFASSNPDASCALLTDLYDQKTQEPDPSDLYLPGHCNLSFSYVGQPPVAEIDLQDDGTGGTVVAVCAYEDGTWEYVSGGSDPGYYYTGTMYQGAAWKGTFQIDFHDQGAAQLKVTADIREFEGTYPYGEPGQHKASGKVQGEVYTTECEGFELDGTF